MGVYLYMYENFVKMKNENLDTFDAYPGIYIYIYI
jgi:hypothetical protein